MSLQQLEQEALHLTEGERASLVLSLMETLGAPDGDVTDEEVARRDAELHDGSVHPISQEEFVRRVRAAMALCKARAVRCLRQTDATIGPRCVFIGQDERT
jgi:hypothetical protein